MKLSFEWHNSEGIHLEMMQFLLDQFLTKDNSSCGSKAT
jgi:hypothetical protein